MPPLGHGTKPRETPIAKKTTCRQLVEGTMLRILLPKNKTQVYG